MYRHYLKQAWNLLKENKFYSLIYIIGTAFTITMVMLILGTYYIKTADFPPEINRDRMLYVTAAKVELKEPGAYWSAAMLSSRLVKEAFYTLEIPEAVCAVIPFFPIGVSMPGSEDVVIRDRLATDVTFWQIFQFDFIEGKPYDEADFESGLKKIVVSERIARELYGTTQIIGETVELNKEAYSVCGVVKNVPTIAERAYADIWVPYTATHEKDFNWDDEKVIGPFHVYILAKSKKDFEAIRKEVDGKIAIINSAHEKVNAVLLGQPDTQLAQYLRKSNSEGINLSREIRKYLLVIFFLLLIPAMNISGLIVSRMKKREAELGLRKAFGAPSGTLIFQVLVENFLPVLIGGIIGLLFSACMIRMLSSFFLTSSYSAHFISSVSTPDLVRLINPETFLYVFVLCLILNVASALIPAWRTTRIPIVDALKNK